MQRATFPERSTRLPSVLSHRVRRRTKRKAAVFFQPVLEYTEGSLVFQRVAEPSGAAAGSCHFETARRWK